MVAGDGGLNKGAGRAKGGKHRGKGGGEKCSFEDRGDRGRSRFVFYAVMMREGGQVAEALSVYGSTGWLESALEWFDAESLQEGWDVQRVGR